MISDRLITEKPQVKLKGFRSSQIKIIPAIPKDNDILRTIVSLKSTQQYSGLSAKSRALVDRMEESYGKKIKGVALEDADYVLSGHEFVEWDRLEKGQELRYLAYRYRYSKFPELKIIDDYPPCVQIEPSSICNFRCVMCYQTDASFSSRNSGHMGFLGLDLFKKAVDELEGHVEAITLASRGEPTLNKAFIPMLEYCRGKFLGLKVNSNASIMSEEIVHALFSNDVSTIVFSIDSADKKRYEEIRVGGKFVTLLQNLERFRNIRQKHYSASKTIVRISGVKINDDQNIDHMNEAWKKYADIIAFTNYTPWQSAYENPANDIESPCSELWRRLFVWQDGRVNPCDTDYKSTLSRWNLGTQTLSRIWNSSEYNELRRLHLAKERNKIEPCRRCISV